MEDQGQTRVRGAAGGAALRRHRGQRGRRALERVEVVRVENGLRKIGKPGCVAFSRVDKTAAKLPSPLVVNAVKSSQPCINPEACTAGRHWAHLI